MGFVDNIIKRVAKTAAEELRASDLAKAATDRPAVTEIPPVMQLGYASTGGARRKFNSIVDFDTLRTFSVVYDVARACINHRKRQLANLEWSIVPIDEGADPNTSRKRAEEITLFFEEPAHGNDFKMFLDKIVEDLLVLDAAVLWKDRTYSRKLKELLPVDATTIRMKISPDGTLPEPPNVAYQQILFGEVKGEYTTDEMYYKMINPRTNTPYGLSPLECLIIGVDAALRSQMYNASLLSEGTVPEGFLSLPEEWTADQIKDYQVWFDSIMAGNFAQNSRIKMIPGGKGVGYTPTKKVEDMRMLEFEKWLLLKTCALFDVQPEAIGFVENITRTTGEVQQQMGNERGLVPMANFIKKFFTQIIHKDFGATDLKFEWKGLQVVDDVFELERAKVLLERGGLTINELRVEQGYEPLKEEYADKPMVYTASGPVPLESVEEHNEQPEPTAGGAVKEKEEEEEDDTVKMELEDLTKWESKAVSSFKKGKGAPRFKSIYIDRAVMTLIDTGLAAAKTKSDVAEVFRPFKQDALERSLVRRAYALQSEVSAAKRDRYERTRPSA